MTIKNICSALIIQEGKFVIVKEADGYMAGKWNIPGGHLETHESICSAAIREAKEETNLDIELDGLIGIYQFKSPAGNNVLQHCFKASIIGGEPKHQAGELEDIKFISFHDFLQMDDDKIGHMHLKTIIKNYLEKGSVKNIVFISEL